MRGDAVDHFRRLAMLLEKLRANHRMRTLRLVVQRLADVVEEPHTACDRRVRAHLRRQHAHQVSDLNRVPQDVLCEAGTELETSHAAQQLIGHPLHLRLVSGRFTRLENGLIHAFRHILHNLFDAGWMDAPV